MNKNDFGLTLTWIALCAFVLPYPTWILGAIYHYSYPLSVVVAVVFGAGGFLFLLAQLIRKLLPGKYLVYFFDASFMVIALFLAQGVIRQFIPDDVSFPKWLRVGLSLFGLCAALGLAAIRNQTAKEKMRRAAVVFSVVFSVSPTLISAFSGGPAILQLKKMQQGEAEIYLVLDEMGSKAASRAIAQMRARNINIRLEQAPSIGTDTINVLPEMLGAPHMPDAKVCGFTAVCDSTHVFDFSRLAIKSEQPAHMVGFFHPYCAASGWASCILVAMPIENPVHSFACSYSRLIPSGWKLCDWMDDQRWNEFKQGYYHQFWLSPFWQQGGRLVAHIPLPHPPGSIRGASFTQDYESNVQEVGQLLQQIYDRASGRFGSNFRIYVTSDHPVRSRVWCATGKYQNNGCDMSRYADDNQVPLLLIFPRKELQLGIKSNGDFLKNPTQK